MTRPTVALALGLLLTAAAAHAAPTTQTQAVRRGGLDLSRSAEAGVMLARLERASLEVCGSGRGSAKAVQDETRSSVCYAEALGAAVAAFKAPTLTTAFTAAYPGQARTRRASIDH